MSSKNKNVIRFAVGTPEDIKSWVWRFWVQGDEVYLGTKQALQVFKVSLHKSNIWRIAFVSDLKRDDEESDRVIVKWNKPGEFAVGWTSSIGIIVSSIEPEHSFSKLKVDDIRIKWFNSPLEGNKLIFKVLFSKSGLLDKDFKNISRPNDRLVGKLVKKNGETVWLVVREEDMTQIEIEKVKDVMEKTKIHYESRTQEEHFGESRALLVCSEPSPSILTQPTIIDISLGKENIEIPQFFLI